MPATNRPADCLFFYWMSLNKWLNNNWWRRLGKRLLFNDIQSKRGNQRDGFWLAHMNLATHSSRSNTVGFWFLWGLAPGRLDGFSIGSYEKNRESFHLYAAKFESVAMRYWGEKSLRRWNPFKTRFPLLSFYYMEQSTANSNSFKIAQKTAFEAKGRLYTTGKVIQRLFIIDLYT